MPGAETRLLLTCEHGGNTIPKAFAPLFRTKAKLLASHRGWDPGALEIARSLARSMRAHLVAATTSRLLVDLNRSPGNPRAFSAMTAALARPERAAILARHHAPHWQRVMDRIAPLPVTTIHVAVHSFTPILDGVPRPFSVGLLYDPKRANELRLATAWQAALRDRLGRGEVRRNAPYRGDSDGLTTALRKRHGAGHYLGIELELNQACIATARARRALVPKLAESLRDAMRDCVSR